MNAEFQFKHEIPVQIRFSDVDQYGHMNNSVYFSLYDLAKTSYFRDVFGEEERDKFNVVVVNINADFLAPVFFSDELMIETTVIHLGHKSLTMLQRAFNKASGVLKCQCRTVLVGYDILTKDYILNRDKCISNAGGCTFQTVAKRTKRPVFRSRTGGGILCQNSASPSLFPDLAQPHSSTASRRFTYTWRV